MNDLKAQEKNVASFNTIKISETEFRERYNFTPQVDDRGFASDSGKTQFLASLIAEKLWAEEAVRLGFDQNENYLGYIAILKKMIVRDELFKAVIESKVKISDSDLKRAEAFSKITLSAINISNNDSVYIHSIYSLLKDRRLDFDSVFLSQPPPANKNMLVLKYGNIVDENIEAVVFSTKAGNFTKPLKDGDIWHLFKVLKTETEKGEPKDPIDTYKNRLKERRLKSAGEAYLEKLLKDIKVDINRESAEILNKMFEARLISKYPSAASDSLLVLNESDFSLLYKAATTEILQRPVIMFQESPLQMSDIFHYFSFYGFSIKAGETGNLRKKIVRELHKITQDELLYREGMKTIPGAEIAAEKQISVWRANALAQLLRNRYLDSVVVSENDAREFYKKMNSTGEAEGRLSVDVIFHGKLETVSTILDKLSAGEEFSTLSANYPQKKYKSGTMVQIKHFSPFEEQLEKAKIGEVIGPLKGDKGFYIFKILNKKEADSVFLKPFDSVKKDVELILKAKQSERLLNQRTTELAVKYSVKISDDVLKSIKGRTIPMYMYRFMGFGGRITAAPFTSPMYEWLKEYRKREELAP